VRLGMARHFGKTPEFCISLQPLHGNEDTELLEYVKTVSSLQFYIFSFFSSLK